MSLLDLLLNEPSTAERAMGVIASMQSAGGHDPRSSADLGSPPGRGIFGNDQVDVLEAGDPRLVDRYGVTLARPAMRSLSGVFRSLGIHPGDAGGGYRTASEQAGMNPALAAPVGQSYHQEGLAIDLASALQNARVERALQAAGWNRFSPGGEPWHWSYGVTG